MKSTNNNIQDQPQNQDQLNENQLNELENDTVWSLLENTEKASPIEASPMFSRNVMRETRLQDQEPFPSLIQRIFAPKFSKVALTICATAACALVAINLSSDQNNNPDTIVTTTTDTEFIQDISLEELSAYSEIISDDTQAAVADDFTSEMLQLADQDPFYISEEEIALAMNL